jgi:hypothetical protein
MAIMPSAGGWQTGFQVRRHLKAAIQELRNAKSSKKKQGLSGLCLLGFSSTSTASWQRKIQAV